MKKKKIIIFFQMVFLILIQKVLLQKVQTLRFTKIFLIMKNKIQEYMVFPLMEI